MSFSEFQGNGTQIWITYVQLKVLAVLICDILLRQIWIYLFILTLSLVYSDWQWIGICFFNVGLSQTEELKSKLSVNKIFLGYQLYQLVKHHWCIRNHLCYHEVYDVFVWWGRRWSLKCWCVCVYTNALYVPLNTFNTESVMYDLKFSQQLTQQSNYNVDSWFFFYVTFHTVCSLEQYILAKCSYHQVQLSAFILLH